MSPTQVCVLLMAVMAAGLGAPLARSAPAAATPQLPSPETAGQPAGQGLFGRRLSAAAADADGQPPLPPEGPTDGEQPTAPAEDDDQTPPPPTSTAPAEPRATARPGVPAAHRSLVSRRRSGRRRPKTAPTVSSETEQRATKRSDGFSRAKTAPSSRAASETRPKPSVDSHHAAATAPVRGSVRADRSASSDEVEQEASGSSRVLTYHVQHTQHSRVAKSPRESPDFFVPPIRRRPSRRRVPLSAQTQTSGAASGRSLGEQLAQQVRRQLAKLEAQQEKQQQEKQEEKQQEPASSTTERPHQAPFVPTAPTTTPTPYQHPFIPSSPTTTSEPYKHPFIPSPPTTTSEPYVHPFIPSSPTTTSEPYVHPFIPSSPTTTSEPYRHPHIPVPPESTRQPPVQKQRQQRPVEKSAEGSAEELAAEERPQARRVPSGSEAAVPRLHLPRKPAPTAAGPTTTSTAAPAPASATATIVHQQKLEAGFIVGEYGELGHSGGTVRGVKYAAESSVDRRLLEAALRQFLEL